MKNDQDIMNSIRAAIDDCTRGIEDTPSLQYQIARKAKGEEPVKKKLSASAILVIALIAISMTAALAATLSNWGIIDFAGNHADSYIPPKYEDSIKKENLPVETENLVCTIEESYFDGIILRVTARISPKGDTLLIGAGSGPEDPISDLIRSRENEDDESPKESLGAYAIRAHSGHMAEVTLNPRIDWADLATDFIMNDDGSYTIYFECQCDSESEEIESILTLRYIPMTVSEELLDAEEVDYDFDHQEVTEIPMTFRSAQTRRLVCDTQMDFPSVGVRVTNVVMIVTPLEIRNIIDYEITDLDAFNAQEGGLWFEFIDPNSTATEFYEQRVSAGLSSGGSVGRVDGMEDQPDEVGTVYRQKDAIGLDALSDQYTIRAYSSWEKTRYEERTFTVK